MAGALAVPAWPAAMTAAEMREDRETELDRRRQPHFSEGNPVHR
jgi:hypothetical protein